MGNTVLLVDDSLTLRGFISLALEDSGYRVLLAKSTMEAFYILSEGNVDIVLTEYILSDMNGNEFISQLQNRKKKRQIPTIVLTTCSQDKARQEVEIADANACLAKPFDLDELYGLLGSFRSNS